MNRLFLPGALLGCAVLFFSGSASARTAVRVGVIDGPQAEVMQEVRKVASPGDLDVVVVPYREGAAINRDLAAGRLDAASFQGGVELAEEARAHGYPLSPAALTVTLPTGLYSRKVGSIAALRTGAEVAIPRDRLAAARALVLLHNYGLIRIRDGAGFRATVRDIVRNPRRLRFVELPAGRLAGRLDEVSLAAIPYPEAAKAGLQPARDGIGMEDGRSPWAGVLTVRSADREKPWVGRLVAACHSEEIKRFILLRYRDSVRRPW